MKKLSPKEEQMLRKFKADLRFYKTYKEFMGEVKVTFLNKGPQAARQLIRERTDDILQMACDELFNDLFS